MTGMKFAFVLRFYPRILAIVLCVCFQDGGAHVPGPVGRGQETLDGRDGRQGARELSPTFILGYQNIVYRLTGFFCFNQLKLIMLIYVYFVYNFK